MSGTGLKCACCGTHPVAPDSVYCEHCEWPGHFCQACGACRDVHHPECQRFDQVEKRKQQAGVAEWDTQQA